MTELAFLGARELTHKLRRKDLSSVELVDYFLARIEEKNAALNAVVTRVDPERARSEARAADKRLAAGGWLGPLHGIPMTIKDAFEVAGMRTTAGAKVWGEHVSTRDALSVARLRAAGAIIIGKTNTPAFCSDVQSYNTLFGTTHNPWDLTRTPGGSSGGATAALAAGMTPIELGSDIAGSIRTPAGFCGLFGHKPTHGLVPMRGHMPGAPGTLSQSDLVVAGPLARSADDLALLLDVLAGPEPELAIAYRLQLPAARSESLRGFRVATWLDDAAFPVDASVRDALEAAVSTLQEAGADVRAAKPNVALIDIYRLYRALLDPILSVGLPARVVSDMEQIVGGADSAANYARNALIRQRDHVVLLEFRAQLKAAWQQFFESYDVLLCPITMVPAITHDQTEPMRARRLTVNGAAREYEDLFVWASLATCAHLPATAMPVGRTAAGLPVGLQIIGPYLEDHTPISFAARASDVLGGFVRPPGY